jgi:hypothetical protein
LRHEEGYREQGTGYRSEQNGRWKSKDGREVENGAIYN